jgi:outer membrane protein OmpA-like peptidoglycan-associated protein
VHPILVLGIEASSRTSLENINVKTDPLWLTPSIQLRTPYYFNVIFGSDISLSQGRTGTDVRALEPFRLFGGFVFSFDLMQRKRHAAMEKERHMAAEKTAMEKKAREAQARSDGLALKARTDSLAAAKARDAERLRADSLALKARQDSIVLAETQKKLDEERSKRSDAEKQLLSTGLLLLDAVYFETGKSEININSYPYLNIIGKMLTKYPKLQIEVSGHTDNIGKFQMNMGLSQMRADAVRIYLIQVAPELSGRISARGYGPTQPKSPNTNAQGRRLNRRVELQVLNREALKEYNQ